ncbi:MAG: hypothetical protein ACI8P0_005740, partial [Planctomycetaceae bacterium]
SNWFDDSYISCGGGIGGVSSPHDLATKRGDDVARPFVVQYLGLLKEGDLDAIREFVHTDVSQALQDPPVADPVVQ